jgi:hypothetical protein
MFLLFAIALQLQVPDGNRDVVLGPRQAFVMLPPDVVCGPRVEYLVWSPDGKFLAAKRVTEELTANVVRKVYLGEDVPPPAPKVEVWIWNAQTKTSRIAYRGDEATADVQGLSWMGSSGTLLITTHSFVEGHRVASFWLAKNSGLSRLPLPDGELWDAPLISPTHDIGALVSMQRREVVRFFDSSGRIGPELSVKNPIYEIVWRGATPSMPIYNRANGRLMLTGYVDIDKRTGALKPTSIPARAPAIDPNQLILTSSPVEVRAGEADLVRVMPIGASPPEATKGSDTRAGLVAADAQDAAVAPGNRAVSYISQGIAMVRQLVPLPREAYEKAEAVNIAKQVGLALSIYSTDYDDEFPPNTNWQEITNPYIKDMSMLRVFNYTFAGGQLPPGTDPSKFEIGFMTGPGGRAVVYADGSVKWEKA